MAMEALCDCGMDILALYTYYQPDEDGWFEAPEGYAKKVGVPVFKEPDFNAAAVRGHIQTLAPDFLFSFYFREMIKAETLQIPQLGAFNLHGSLLPKYRGRAPINWVLVKGEAKTGVTLHAMTPKPDDGDVFGQKEIPIAWDETALGLTKKAAQAGFELLRETVPLLVDGSIEGVPQKTLGDSSYYGGRKPADSRLHSGMTAQEAFNQIRAVADPWPNAFLEGDGGLVKVPWALPSGSKCRPGRFRRAGEGILLGFADAPLLLVALKNGAGKAAKRSDDPETQAEWLKAIGVGEDCV
jgi:methionyl-tRNA formyltransferase